MGKKTVLFKNDERKDLRDIAAFFRQLADKIEDGEIILRQGEKETHLQLPATVKFEVEVAEKPKKRGVQQSLEIEFEWYEGETGESITLG